MTDARQFADVLGMLIGQLQRAAGAEELSLTSTQRIVLAELFAAGPLRVGAIAERAGAPDATISRAVDGLVSVGLASRHADPDDARAVLVSATARGRERMDLRRRAMAKTLTTALAAMPPQDGERLLELVTALVAQLDAIRLPDARRGALLAP